MVCRSGEGVAVGDSLEAGAWSGCCLTSGQTRKQRKTSAVAQPMSPFFRLSPLSHELVLFIPRVGYPISVSALWKTETPKGVPCPAPRVD